MAVEHVNHDLFPLAQFGSKQELAELALDAIYALSNTECAEGKVWDFERRWVSLVRVPGGSHFPSRSACSSTEGV